MLLGAKFVRMSGLNREKESKSKTKRESETHKINEQHTDIHSFHMFATLVSSSCHPVLSFSKGDMGPLH